MRPELAAPAALCVKAIESRDRVALMSARDDKHGWIPAHHAAGVMSGMTKKRF